MITLKTASLFIACAAVPLCARTEDPAPAQNPPAQTAAPASTPAPAAAPAVSAPATQPAPAAATPADPKSIVMGAEMNPVPLIKFAGFGSYEIKPLKMGPPYAGQKANEKAVAKIQEHLNQIVGPTINGWNTTGQTSGNKDLKLVIEPNIATIKFIGGGARFFAGPLAGNSYVVIKVKFTEQPSGRVIAEPEFYQRAQAWSGAFTLGAQDNVMLERIVTVFSDYLKNNYDQAIGGRTGRDANMDPKNSEKK